MVDSIRRLQPMEPPGPMESVNDWAIYLQKVQDYLASVQSIIDRRILPQLRKVEEEVDAGGGTTGSNLGSGSNVFKQKTGVDFEFRSINASSGVTDAQSATEVTLVLDIDTLGQLSVAPADTDKVAIYDVDAAANKYIEVADLMSVGVADTQTAASSGTRGDAQMASGIRVARFTTVGSGHSMTLPNPSGAGDSCIVMNDGANALKVWADTGDSVEGGTDVSLAAAGRAHFVSMTGTAWYEL